MRPDDIGHHGTDLLERVRREVDTARRLDSLRHRHRRVRFTLVVAAATAVIAAFFGIALLMRPVEQPPAVPSPLRPLPVEVSIVLLDQFTITPDDESCEGNGSFSPIRAGATAQFTDDLSGEEIQSLDIPAGVVVDEAGLASIGVTAPRPTACRFVLEAPGLDMEDFNGISLFLEPLVAGELPGLGEVRSGQRLTYIPGGE